MEELKPCPHCGGRAVVVEGKRPENIGRYSVTCGQCFCSTPWEINKENAKFDWNRRAEPENKVLTLEQLRQMDGEPVWIVPLDGTGCGEWTIIAIGAQTETLKALSPDTAYEECNYGKTWLAYARRPEDAQKGSKTHA